MLMSLDVVEHFFHFHVTHEIQSGAKMLLMDGYP